MTIAVGVCMTSYACFVNKYIHVSHNKRVARRQKALKLRILLRRLYSHPWNVCFAAADPDRITARTSMSRHFTSQNDRLRCTGKRGVFARST
jgi:hypothetical protein